MSAQTAIPIRVPSEGTEPEGVYTVDLLIERFTRRMNQRLGNLEELVATGDVEQEAILHELADIRVMKDRLAALARQALSEKGMLAQVGAYIGPAEPLAGLERARIRVAGREYEAPLDPTVKLESLRKGARLLVTGSGDRVIAYRVERPAGGVILRVAGPGSQEDFIEVESENGLTREVSVSDFIEGEVQTGSRVRVVDEDAVQVVSTEVVEQSGFRDACRWEPEGWTFDDIVGQDDACDELAKLAHRFAHPERYGGEQVLARLGNLIRFLVGPPGNGKTIMASALFDSLRKELGPSAFYGYLVRGSQFKDKWVGNTGKNIRAIFDLSIRDFKEKGISSLICLEEVDDAGTDRSSVSNTIDPVGTSATTQLLTYFDGSVPLGPGVFVLCLSNHLPNLDEALLRPGRAGGCRVIEVPRLGVDATLRIVRLEIEKLPPEWIQPGTKPDDYVRAVGRALEMDAYGRAIVGTQSVAIKGSWLTSGAMGTDAVRAGIELLHTHIYRCSRAGRTTPFQRLTPAAVYHGAVRTLAGVLKVYAGPPNLRRARAFFAGGLVDRDEPAALSEVIATPAWELPPSHPEYDLSPMRELEVVR